MTYTSTRIEFTKASNICQALRIVLTPKILVIEAAWGHIFCAYVLIAASLRKLNAWGI